MTETRDRDATKAKLLKAVRDTILEEGFGGMGMRAIARRAGVDKVLIYRYFGGLPGLLSAFAEEGDFWWSVDDVLGDVPAEPTEGELPAALASVFRCHVAFLRSHPITLEVIAWELHDRNELTEALESVREARSQDMMRRLADRFGIDLPTFLATYGAVLALLGAAANYLAARGRRLRLFNGIDLQDEAGWAAVADAAEAMIGGVTSRGSNPSKPN